MPRKGRRSRAAVRRWREKLGPSYSEAILDIPRADKPELCPKFLHTNSTSHTWPFSAIAELIDNAYDPDVNAKQFWIDKTVIKGNECLTFMDNGNGLDHDTMHKMLSFGYSDKTPIEVVKPISMYGTGFKSASMRLGRDAMVFSKSESALCVGMLSQTYLEQIGANQISVPIVCFEEKVKNTFSVREEHKASLQDILQYSPFKTQGDFLNEVRAIGSSWSAGKTGTRIIIWNLRRTSTGGAELDFTKDRYDMRIPSDVYETMNGNQPTDTSYIPDTFYSLRAYCSILYLKPRMQIIIRGQKVKSQLVAKNLAYIRKDHYNPSFLTKRVPVTFGYNTKSKEQYGIMMYHKNRLIKAYERVGCQLKANNKGVGVIGVIECYFLEPTHNKQSFYETDDYRRTLHTLGTKVEEYWNEIRFSQKRDHPNSATPVEDTMKRPDQNWVQCDDCLKWRKLPDGIDNSKPDKWYCRMNPDPQFRICEVEQEAVDSDDEQPSYRKTYKQQEKEDKRLQDIERQKVVEAQKRKVERRLTNLTEQKQAPGPLQTTHPPSTPTRAESSPLRSSPVSQAACSPSSSSGLPVISSVCSLSTASLPTTPRRKRTQHVTLQTTPKRPKINGNLDNPPSTPSVIIDDDDDTDDDIYILENGSTPTPKKPGFVLTKVRDAHVGMLLECSDDAAADDASETNAAGSAAMGTSPSPAPLPAASIATQTNVTRVKLEEGHQNQTEGEKRAEPSTSTQSGGEQSSGVDKGVGSVEQRVMKQENGGDARSTNQGKQTLQKEGEKDAGASCAGANAPDDNNSPHQYPSVTQVQEQQDQQDQLLELMQATAVERDSFQEQVHKLTCQLQDMQNRLQEKSPINVKKECSHQASQTEGEEGEGDYKVLFEKANQKISELLKDKELLLAASETKLSTARSEEEDIDQIAMQVDHLMRELDQGQKEKDELRSQLDSLEEERANLTCQCEELRLRLQQQRGNAQEGSTTSSTRQTDPVETSNCSTYSSSDASRSLIELRHNIGRLLITHVPALDLGQVNYECNVIDEILEQVLSNMASNPPIGQREGFFNNGETNS